MWLAAILNIAAKTIPEVLVRLDDQQELGNEIVAEDHVLLELLFFLLQQRRRQIMERQFLCFAVVVASLFTCCFAYSNGTVPAIIWHGMGWYFNRIAEDLENSGREFPSKLFHFNLYF